MHRRLMQVSFGPRSAMGAAKARSALIQPSQQLQAYAEAIRMCPFKQLSRYQGLLAASLTVDKGAGTPAHDGARASRGECLPGEPPGMALSGCGRPRREVGVVAEAAALGRDRAGRPAHRWTPREVTKWLRTQHPDERSVSFQSLYKYLEDKPEDWFVTELIVSERLHRGVFRLLRAPGAHRTHRGGSRRH